MDHRVVGTQWVDDLFLTYGYVLLPTRRQHRALEAILESQRQLYNAALEERIGAYRCAGLTRTYYDQTNGLTEWRRSDPEAREIPANIQRATLKRLDDAYRGFFRRARAGQVPGYPRFRGKGRFDSFGFREFCGISLRKGRLRFKGMPGCLRVHFHRPMPEGAPIRGCAFRRTAKGWSVAFVVERVAGTIRPANRAVGLDLGIANFATLSDGRSIPSLHAARRAERRMRIAQRAVARAKPRSRGRINAIRTVKRLHAAIARRRANHLHQASSGLVRDYDLIVVESLNVGGLARSALAKHVRDASWSKFISMLRYKAECAGARMIEVDPRNTSQDCSGCGLSVPKDLADRQHECPHCGLSIDRDLNAARNILNRAGAGPGLRNARSGPRAGGNLDASGCSIESLPMTTLPS